VVGTGYKQVYPFSCKGGTLNAKADKLYNLKTGK